MDGFRPYEITLPYQFAFDFFETRERGGEDEPSPFWRGIGATWDAAPRRRRGPRVLIERPADERELKAEAEFYLSFDGMDGLDHLRRAGRTLLNRIERARGRIECRT